MSLSKLVPVDAIPISCRWRAIIKHMTKMSITNCTQNFLSGHENDGQVQLRLYIVSNRLIIRWPSSSTVKFGRWSGKAMLAYRFMHILGVPKSLEGKKLVWSRIHTQKEESHNRCSGKFQGFWYSSIPWSKYMQQREIISTKTYHI